MAWKCLLSLVVLALVYSPVDASGRQNHSYTLRFIPKDKRIAANTNPFFRQNVSNRMKNGFIKESETLESRKNCTRGDNHTNATGAKSAGDFEEQDRHVETGDTTSTSQSKTISVDQSSQNIIEGSERKRDGFDFLPLLSFTDSVREELQLPAHFDEDQPIDFFRCDTCLCFRSTEGQMVYAICRKFDTKKVALKSIPQDLPFDTVYLNMYGNHMSYFEISTLTKYQYMLTVNASGNQIKDLKVENCLHIRLQNLDLSYNKISNLSDGVLSCLSDLTHLNLRGNHITELRNGSLTELAKLRVLDLSSNKLHKIHARAFNPIRGLIELDLSSNRICFSCINPEIFSPLASLEVFSIQRCAQSPTRNYPTDLLLQLPALQDLAVNGELQPFESRLSKLKNLTRLTIGVETARHSHFCWTKNFTSSYFSGLCHLQSVKILGCRNSEYSNLMFHNNTRITSFQLSYGPRNVTALFEILCSLPQNSIKHIDISKNINEPYWDPLIVLDSREVKCLGKMKNLVSLNMDKNFISQVDISFSTGLPKSLETLSLRGNLLTASQSLLIQFLDPAKIKFPNLKELFEDAQGVQSLKTPDPLYLSGSSDNKDISIGLNPWSVDYGNMLRHLHKYNASRTINIGIDVFRKKTVEVDILDFSNTYLTRWGYAPVEHLPQQTRVAHLSNNKCAYFRNSFFKGNNSLVKLYAESNFLGPLLSKDIHGSKFSRLRNLEYLDLSRNHLFALPWRLFQGIPSLRILKLRSNNINHIDIHIAHMTRLIYLDLAKNSISSISKRTRKELDYLAENGNISIDLTYNSLPCTCKGFELLSWMSRTRVRILNKDFLQCINSNNHEELVGDLNKRVQNLHSECISKKLLIVICSFSLAVLLLLAASVWAFQKRWWIVYKWSLVVSRFFGFQKRGNPGKSVALRFTFDAFFVYAATKSDFVLGECLEELETKRRHRLCVEDRDFLVGSYLPCNITSAVRSSRTTVVVLDEHFRAEGWVQYAVEMAQVEAVRSKRDVLHLLFVGSPPDGCLPGAYLKVLRQGRFSEVPPKECPPNVREKFWDTFSRLLGHTETRRSRLHPRLELTD